LDFEPVDAAFVEGCLRDAGQTLTAMRASGHSLGMRISRLDVYDPADAILYAHNTPSNRPAVPKSDRIDAMDSIFSWLALVDNKTIRRILAARAIVDLAGRPQSWRSIARRLDVSHHAAKSWHAKGIAVIVAALNG
jgi:hypothetical protein